MNKFDNLLTEALMPSAEINSSLQKRIIEKAIGSESEKHGFTHKRVLIPAAVALILIMLAAFTVWKLLTPQEVATKLEDSRLAAAFGELGDTFEIRSQQYGKYNISLLGMVSGNQVSDHINIDNGERIDDKTYVVVAISHQDGSPMPDPSSIEYDQERFLVSPYVEGLNPLWYNILTFGGGGYSEFNENGIRYRLIHTANIEPFADRTIYLGVTDGTFYNRDAFLFDEGSGAITRNDDYDGLNALFVLSIDPSKADPAKAQEIIERIESPK